MRNVKLLPFFLVVFVSNCSNNGLEFPVLISPNGEEYNIHDRSIQFTWQYPDTASSYFLQVAQDSRFHKIILSDSTIKDTFFFISIDSFVQDNTYFWRVCAYKSDAWSEWSDTNFTFKAYQLVVPELITPIGSEYHIYDKGILFTWESAWGPVKYDLEVAKDENFHELLFSDSTIENLSQVIPIDSFLLNNTYFWRVRESDWKSWGEWSNPATFSYELGFDLDTTYFPFYYGREWRYECHHYGNDSLGTWDYYDTLTITVTDSIWKSGVLNINLDTAFILLPNPVRITTMGWIDIEGFLSTSVPLTPFEVSQGYKPASDYDYFFQSLDIFYIGDTLVMSSSYTQEFWGYKTILDSLFSDLGVGVGVISQRIHHIEIMEDSTTNFDYVDFDLILSNPRANPLTRR